MKFVLYTGLVFENGGFKRRNVISLLPDTEAEEQKRLGLEVAHQSGQIFDEGAFRIVEVTLKEEAQQALTALWEFARCELPDSLLALGEVHAQIYGLGVSDKAARLI